MAKGKANPFSVHSTMHKIGDSGRKSEERLAKQLGARLTPASGAVQGFKSDMLLNDYRIEAKSTQTATMSIKLEWLVKITEEALNSNKIPVLTVSYVTPAGKPRRFGDWVMIPMTHYEELKDNQK